jgi:hypothetical protein
MQAPLESAYTTPGYGPRTWIMDTDEAAIVAHAEKYTGQPMHLLRERPTSRVYRTADQTRILTVRSAGRTRDAIRKFKTAGACRPPFQPPHQEPNHRTGEPDAQTATHRP